MECVCEDQKARSDLTSVPNPVDSQSAIKEGTLVARRRWPTMHYWTPGRRSIWYSVCTQYRTAAMHRAVRTVLDATYGCCVKLACFCYTHEIHIEIIDALNAYVRQKTFTKTGITSAITQLQGFCRVSAGVAETRQLCYGRCNRFLW
jgi:hypothetical protein